MGIKSIRAGGQTGVDRAALDAALELGVPCCGWCPKGRLAEDGPIDGRYPLTETPTAAYAERTEWNVRDSDGTLVLTWGTPTGGTEETVEFAFAMGKPCHLVDLERSLDTNLTREWIETKNIEELNVAGPRGSKHPEVYARALAFMRALLEG